MTHRAHPPISLHPRPFVVLLATGLTAGCTPSLPSDADVVSVTFPGTHDIDDRLVAPGAHLCPDEVTDLATSSTVDQCYTFGGALEVWDATNGCLSGSAPGAASLLLTAVPCEVDGAAFTAEDDTLTVEIVDPASLTASVHWLEEDALLPDISLAVPIPTGTFPADGEPLRVASYSTMALTPELRRSVDDERVGWSEDQLSAMVDGPAVHASLDDGGRIRIEVADGANADVSVTLTGAGTWLLTHIEADPGPYTLESVYSAVLAGDDGHSQPMGARAVVRNSAGDLVFGAPVTWSSDVLSVSAGVDAGLPSADYAGLADECRDPNALSGEQRATLTASLDDQSISAEVAWNPAPGDGDVWTAPDGCEDENSNDKLTPSCGCAAGRGDEGALGVILALGLVALGRRGRRGQ